MAVELADAVSPGRVIDAFAVARDATVVLVRVGGRVSRRRVRRRSRPCWPARRCPAPSLATARLRRGSASDWLRAVGRTTPHRTRTRPRPPGFARPGQRCPGRRTPRGVPDEPRAILAALEPSPRPVAGRCPSTEATRLPILLVRQMPNPLVESRSILGVVLLGHQRVAAVCATPSARSPCRPRGTIPWTPQMTGRPVGRLWHATRVRKDGQSAAL